MRTKLFLAVLCLPGCMGNARENSANPGADLSSNVGTMPSIRETPSVPDLQEEQPLGVAFTLAEASPEGSIARHDHSVVLAVMVTVARVESGDPSWDESTHPLAVTAEIEVCGASAAPPLEADLVIDRTRTLAQATGVPEELEGGCTKQTFTFFHESGNPLVSLERGGGHCPNFFIEVDLSDVAIGARLRPALVDLTAEEELDSTGLPVIGDELIVALR